MNLETIFKVSLVILVIAIGEYLEVEKGPLQVGFLSLFLIYLIGKHLHIRKIIRENRADVFVLKKNNWALALITWGVLAAMFLKNLDGVYFIVNAILLVGVMVLIAISESAEEYIINQKGIRNLKTSEKINIDSISEIKMSSNALGIHTKGDNAELLIEGKKLRFMDLSQVMNALERIQKNRVQ